MQEQSVLLDSHLERGLTNIENLKNSMLSPFFTFFPLALSLLLCCAVTVWAAPGREGEICYSFPVQPVEKAAFSRGGHSYPGIDIFGKPGTAFVAPVSGTIEDLQRNDEWDEKNNDAEKKGGRWVSLIGDDGFRYYGSHLESVSEKIRIGQRIRPGEFLGYLGNSGNAGKTPRHLHFGISPATKPYTWKTRRGEVEPYPFLQCTLEKGCSPQAVLPK